jgi:hypothetical protein
MCVQVECHILLEISWQGLQLYFKPHLNRRSAQEIMAFQNAKSPNFENFKTPKLGVPRQNEVWMQPPWLTTSNTKKGEGGGFP